MRLSKLFLRSPNTSICVREWIPKRSWKISVFTSNPKPSLDNLSGLLGFRDSFLIMTLYYRCLSLAHCRKQSPRSETDQQTNSFWANVRACSWRRGRTGGRTQFAITEWHRQCWRSCCRPGCGKCSSQGYLRAVYPSDLFLVCLLCKFSQFLRLGCIWGTHIVLTGSISSETFEALRLR